MLTTLLTLHFFLESHSHQIRPWLVQKGMTQKTVELIMGSRGGFAFSGAINADTKFTHWYGGLDVTYQFGRVVSLERK